MSGLEGNYENEDDDYEDTSLVCDACDGDGVIDKVVEFISGATVMVECPNCDGYGFLD